MQVRTRNRALWATAALLILLGIAAAIGFGRGSESGALGGLQAKQRANERQFETSSQGTANGGSGGEAAESLRASQEWQQPRTAPGIVAPGAYSAAFAQLTGLGATGGSWSEITKVKYDADDINYRDYYSNSSGGSGLVTGRITGLAADQSGHVYAAGANGGVWRSSTGGGNWTPIADAIPTLSSGDLQLDQDGALWYATGEANTGGTSYVGNGVYRLTSPTSGAFTTADRVGGTELESTTINALRFTATKVWVATLRGIWWHSRTTNAGAWTLSFAPNPAFMRAAPRRTTRTRPTRTSSTTSPSTRRTPTT